MKEFIRTKHKAASLDITPLIDVVFQLLLFFILTSAIVQSAVQVDLPESNTQSNIEDLDMLISVQKDGSIFIGDTATNMAGLLSAVTELAAKKKDARVVLSADKLLEYGIFFEIMEMCKNAGIDSVSLAYTQDNKNSDIK
ncbi:MAG: biopolymer transporter ExbD [Spirochaetaceae bacterium]|jgi:biopolymer transport protein ExbD|nr:biopolymer transporter ExbD [Spirochaetaceae bacterium]